MIRKFIKCTILLSFLFGLALVSQAQSNTRYSERLRAMRFASISGHIGYRLASNALWNSRYVADFDNFSLNGAKMGGIFIGGALDFHLTNEWYIKGIGDLHFYNVSSDVVDGQNASEEVNTLELMAAIIPYREFRIGHKILPYVGLGLGVSGIRSNITSDFFDEELLRRDVSLYAVGLGGVNYILTEEWDVGFEGRLTYRGTYDVEGFGKNSSASLMFAVSMTYHFDARYNRRRLGAHYSGRARAR